MALTWRNVTGFTPSGGTEETELAGKLFNKAITGAKGIAETAQTDLETQNEAAIRERLRGITSEEELIGQRGELTDEAFRQEFGDNFAPGTAGAAFDARLSKIRTEDAFQRSEQVRKNTDILESLRSTFRTRDEIAKGNTPIVHGVLATGNFPNIQADEQGNVTYGDTDTKEFDAFTTAINKAGYTKFESFNTQRNIIRQKARDIGAKPSTLKAVEANLLSDDEVPRLGTQVATDVQNRQSVIADDAMRKVKHIEETFQYDMDRIKPEAELSDDDRLRTKKGLDEHILSKYPTDRTVGFKKGGYNLISEIDGWMQNGILIPPTPEQAARGEIGTRMYPRPIEVEQFLIPSSEDRTFWDHRAVDTEKLQEKLVGYFQGKTAIEDRNAQYGRALIEAKQKRITAIEDDAAVRQKGIKDRAFVNAGITPLDRNAALQGRGREARATLQGREEAAIAETTLPEGTDVGAPGTATEASTAASPSLNAVLARRAAPTPGVKPVNVVDAVDDNQKAAASIPAKAQSILDNAFQKRKTQSNPRAIRGDALFRNAEKNYKEALQDEWESNYRQGQPNRLISARTNEQRREQKNWDRKFNTALEKFQDSARYRAALKLFEDSRRRYKESN